MIKYTFTVIEDLSNEKEEHNYDEMVEESDIHNGSMGVINSFYNKKLSRKS